MLARKARREWFTGASLKSSGEACELSICSSILAFIRDEKVKQSQLYLKSPPKNEI